VSAPEIGEPLPRSGEAWSAREKWTDWILAVDGHGPHWRAVFGEIDADAAWAAIADAVLSAPVVSLRQTAAGGFTGWT
jgi:hypothetical protein